MNPLDLGVHPSLKLYYPSKVVAVYNWWTGLGEGQECENSQAIGHCKFSHAGCNAVGLVSHSFIAHCHRASRSGLHPG